MFKIIRYLFYMTLKACIKSMRLRTLPLSLAGVILGVTLAADNTDVSPWTAALIFLTTVCLQILSNLSNELGDTLNGTDSADRQGPQYALGSGDMTVGDIKSSSEYSSSFASSPVWR